MAKRFTATEIWDEDWFLDIPNEYKLFWFYMLSTCDHAGFFKVNLRTFSSLLGVNIESESAINYFNTGKDRIRVINPTVWLIEDFFVFQYGHIVNLNNPLHRGVETQYIKYNISLSSIRGLLDLKVRVKEKDKEKDSLKEEGVGEENFKNQKNGKEPIINFEAQGANLLARRTAERQREVAERNRKENNQEPT